MTAHHGPSQHRGPPKAGPTSQSENLQDNPLSPLSFSVAAFLLHRRRTHRESHTPISSSAAFIYGEALNLWGLRNPRCSFTFVAFRGLVFQVKSKCGSSFCTLPIYSGFVPFWHLRFHSCIAFMSVTRWMRRESALRCVM